MVMNEDERQLLRQVTLLGIMNRKSDETLDEVMHMLVDTGMYTLKEAKKIFKELKNEKYLVEGHLSLKGLTAAKEAEAIFKQ
jgi:polyhydroxyalkanoate synthesis regulator phasin